MAELLYRLGRGAARRTWIVFTAWLAVLIAVGAGFVLGFGGLSQEITIPDTPTAQVTDRLQEEFPEASGGNGMVVVSTSDGSSISQQQQDELSDLIDEAAHIDGVAEVMDPYATAADRAEQSQQLGEGREQAEAAQEDLAQGQQQLDSAIAAAKANGTYEYAADQFAAQQDQIDQGKAELQDQLEQLTFGEKMLELTEGVRQVSEDGSAAVIPITFDEPTYEVSQETKDTLMDLFRSNPIDGVQVDFSAEIATGVPQILGAGELVGVVVAAIVLLIMLGSLVAAGLPVINALFGVAVAALGSLAFSSVVDMVSVTPILGIMLGLAVGIDYSLFILHRHRRQLKEGHELHESIGLANGTSGSAVVFAGITVVIALLALNVTGIGFLGMMGTVGAVSVAVAVLVAITLTPAWLKVIGMRVLSRKERARLAESPPTTAQVASVKPMRTGSAVLRAVGGIAVLVLIALPATSLRLNLPDGSSEPHESTQYQAYTTIAEEFGAGMNGPLLAVVDLPEAASDEEVGAEQLDIGQQLGAQEDVVGIAPIGASEDGTMLAFQVIPAEGPTSESTEALVHHLRDLNLDGGAQLSIAGQAGGNIDISEKLSEALPLYLTVVVGLSLLILILVFRSILVPVIATAGFILSYFAALGGVVAIYQWGWLSSVFGVESPGPILNFLPTILVGILFGLAMDYMLFLGTGMREAYAHGASAREAVVRGFRAGRSVVTAAAIIMISVFGGFIFADSAMIRPIGFALAFGVLVDAFVVRMLIVPALMHLLGRGAWWLPKWLDRILPDVDVEGAKLERHHPHAEADDDAGDREEPARM